MKATLTRANVAPKGMGLNDFVAYHEGFFAAEGLDVQLDWKTFRGTQSSWKTLEYFQRPQDRPYTEDKQEVIQGACVWGTICNASAGMGRVVPDAMAIHPGPFSFGPTRKFMPLSTSRTCRFPLACAREVTSMSRIVWRDISR